MKVAHLEDPRRPARAGAGGLDDRGPLVRDLEEPARRLPHGGHPRPGRGQGRHRLEGGQSEEGHNGQQDAVESSLADGWDREGEHGNRRQVGTEARERAAESGGADEALLFAGRFPADRSHGGHVVGLAPESEQIRLPLGGVHEAGREIPAQRSEASSRAPAQPPAEPGEGRSAHREAEDGRRRQRRAERPQHEHHEHGDRHRGDAGTDDAHVERLEGGHVLDHTAEEVAAAVARQAGRGQGHEGAVDRHPQARQQAQGHVVRREALEVAQRRAGDTEGADADHRHRDRCDRGVERRLRQEPGGRAHEAHAGGQGQDQQRRSAGSPALLGSEERHQAPPGFAHEAPSQAARSRE